MTTKGQTVPQNLISPKERSASIFIGAAIAVAVKDIRIECRRRHIVGSLILFAFTSVVASTLTLSTWGTKKPIAAVLIWLILYFAAMAGLSRSFVYEEEMSTANLLRVTSSPNSIYLGKLCVNVILMIIMQVVSVPLFILLSGCQPMSWWMMSVVFVVGGIAICISATTSAAIVARAHNKGALYAVISFPLIIPALALSMHATSFALSGNLGITLSDIRMLFYYSIIILITSLMVFKFIWEY